MALAGATGSAIDFARALNFKLALQGAVDAAALAGASEYLNTGSASNAQSLATAYVNNALTALPPSSKVTPVVTTTITNSTYSVVVTATGSINASFIGVIENTIPVSVTATASSTAAPNIDFYLLLDSSPSMGIAATTDGINTMVANTQGQCDAPPPTPPTNPYGGSSCGCAFGCHETNPSAESHYIPTGTYGPNASATPVTGYTHPCSASDNYQYCQFGGSGNPGGEDNYALAKALGVNLRIDNLRTATQSLMTTAQTDATQDDAAYRMAIYTFDTTFPGHINGNINTQGPIQTLTSSLSLAEASAANIDQLQVYQNNCLTSSPCPNSPSDADTDYTDAMTGINAIMPAPGNGTNARGDTPQEVLFFVTDGVEDENVGGTRTQSLMNTSYCTTIKNRGIRIAVLYTEYLQIPTNGWYNTYISPFQSQIEANMQSCATPGLFFKVQEGDDITAAMSALFQTAIKTAYLVK